MLGLLLTLGLSSAMRAGARGYLPKGALKAEVLNAIRGVAAGGAIFGPGLARRMMTFSPSASQLLLSTVCQN